MLTEFRLTPFMIAGVHSHCSQGEVGGTLTWDRPPDRQQAPNAAVSV